MSRRPAAALWAITLALCLAQPATAADSLFMQTYTVATGRPQTFDAAFSVDLGDDCDGHAVYVLSVVTGEDAHGVASARVELNGVEILGPSDFSNASRTLERQFAPLATNRLHVTLTGGKPGATLRVTAERRVADESLCAVPLAVAITSPQPGDVFHQSSVIVRGTVEGRRDLGVAVNGFAAQVDLTHAGTASDPFSWIATVPVSPGAATLRAVASAVSVPQPAEASVAVLIEPPDGRAELSAAPSSGAPPLDVTFDVTVRRIDTVAKVELDLDGDGGYEQTHTTIPQNISFRYQTPGIREARVRVTDTTGGVTVASAAIAVESWAMVDAVIQQRWSMFTSLLEQRRIEEALQLMPGEREREKYRSALTAMSAELPQVAAALRTIEPVYVRGDVAHYLLTRTIDGTVRGFRVYFARGRDGQWKLIQF